MDRPVPGLRPAVQARAAARARGLRRSTRPRSGVARSTSPTTAGVMLAGTPPVRSTCPPDRQRQRHRRRPATTTSTTTRSRTSPSAWREQFGPVRLGVLRLLAARPRPRPRDNDTTYIGPDLVVRHRRDAWQLNACSTSSAATTTRSSPAAPGPDVETRRRLRRAALLPRGAGRPLGPHRPLQPNRPRTTLLPSTRAWR